jgi:hypothetical protein
MAPVIQFYELTPMVLDQAAPVPLTLRVHLDSPATAAVIHFQFINGSVTLTPDAAKTTFTGTIPAAALLTGLAADDVNRRAFGKLTVTPEDFDTWIFGDVLTNTIPAASPQPVAPDVQFSDHLVNINFPALANVFNDPNICVRKQLQAICQAFYQHFDDDYDFLHLVFARDYQQQPTEHNPARIDAKGIGVLQPFDNAWQFGSAGRLLGITFWSHPSAFDGAAPTTMHELGHQWIDHLNFGAFASGNPHWPVSDLASDIMGYSRIVNTHFQEDQFNYDLQPIAGGNFKLVPNNQPKGFSDLSLYLMGMLPANQVGTHFVFNDQTQPIVPNGTLSGPVTNVTIADVIAGANQRVPDFNSSQKRFRVATILVTKSGLAPVEAMRLYDFFAARCAAKAQVPYHQGSIKAMAKPFRVVTNGAGRLDPRIKRHILVDASRDGGVWWSPQPQSGPFNINAPHQGKALADHFRSLLHTVKELTPGTAITPALLADFDIVIRVAGKGAYSAPEIAAYDAWVKDFGSLLLLAEHHPQDQLASHFGLTFKGIVRGQQMLSTFVPHPVTSGVAPIPYPGGSGLTAQPAGATVLGKLSAASFLDLNDNGINDPGEPSAPAGLGVMPFGQGRIVFCGDANLWETVPQPLVKNTLHWFASP